MVKTFIDRLAIARENDGAVYTTRKILALFGYSKTTYINDTILRSAGIIRDVGTMRDSETGKVSGAWQILVPINFKSGR